MIAAIVILVLCVLVGLGLPSWPPARPHVRVELEAERPPLDITRALERGRIDP